MSPIPPARDLIFSFNYEPAHTLLGPIECNLKGIRRPSAPQKEGSDHDETFSERIF